MTTNEIDELRSEIKLLKLQVRSLMTLITHHIPEVHDIQKNIKSESSDQSYSSSDSEESEECKYNVEISELINQYSKNHFTKFIENKRVIIVGPDTYLQGKKMGSYIDSFDIVVRHNTVLDFIPFNQSLKQDYGSRTDVLYLSPQCIKDYAKYKVFRNLKSNKIKFIVYQNGNKDNKYLSGSYCFPKHLDFFKSNLAKIKVSAHYSHHTSRVLSDIMSTFGYPLVPRTGFISVFDMIVHQAKSIDIIGMSFYHGGGHLFRKEIKKPLDPKKNAYGKNSPHDSQVELKLLKELMDFYPISWKNNITNTTVRETNICSESDDNESDENENDKNEDENESDENDDENDESDEDEDENEEDEEDENEDEEKDIISVLQSENEVEISNEVSLDVVPEEISN